MNTISSRLSILAASSRLLFLRSCDSMDRGLLHRTLPALPFLAIYGLLLLGAPLFAREASLHPGADLSFSTSGGSLLYLALIGSVLFSAFGFMALRPGSILLSFLAGSIVMLISLHGEILPSLSAAPLRTLLLAAGSLLLSIASFLTLLLAALALLLRSSPSDLPSRVLDAERLLLRARIDASSFPGPRRPPRPL